MSSLRLLALLEAPSAGTIANRLTNWLRVSRGSELWSGRALIRLTEEWRRRPAKYLHRRETTKRRISRRSLDLIASVPFVGHHLSAVSNNATINYPDRSTNGELCGGHPVRLPTYSLARRYSCTSLCSDSHLTEAEQGIRYRCFDKWKKQLYKEN